MRLSRADMEEFGKEGSSFSDSVYGQWVNGRRLSERQEAAVINTLKRRGYIIESERQQPIPKPQFRPNAGQAAAIDTIMAAIDAGEPVVALTGAGGTGKSMVTTWVVWLMQEWERQRQKGKRPPVVVVAEGVVPLSFVVTATTHPAAAVLRRKGLVAQTVHSAAGLKPRDDGTPGYTGSGATPVIPTQHLTIVDEASMMDAALIDVVMTQSRGTVLLIGDASQLPPVAGGPMFDAYCREIGAPVAELTEVMRCGDVLAEALSYYRLDRWEPEINWPEPIEGVIDYLDPDEVLDDFFGRLPEPEQEMLIAWTNREVNALNGRGRMAEFGPRTVKIPYIEGERMIANSSVIDNGTILLQNGQFVRVRQARERRDMPGVWDVTVAVEQPPGIGFGAQIVEVICAPDTAGEKMLLSEVEDIAMMTQDEFDAMLRSTYGGHPLLEQVVKGRKREDLQDMVAGTEHANDVLAFDEDRRKAWRAFYEVKSRLADLRPRWARTIHKAQGSQSKRVIVLTEGVDRAKDDWRPLVYVALSRAEKNIVLI